MVCRGAQGQVGEICERDFCDAHGPAPPRGDSRCPLDDQRRVDRHVLREKYTMGGRASKKGGIQSECEGG